MRDPAVTWRSVRPLYNRESARYPDSTKPMAYGRMKTSAVRSEPSMMEISRWGSRSTK
jgi:hypothetical protein